MNGLSTGMLRAMGTAGILIGLLGLGVVYNWLVGRVKKVRDFPSSMLVVFGVAFTTLGAYGLQEINGWNLILANSVAFAASGTPMVIGDLWRISNDQELLDRIYTRMIERLSDPRSESYGDETPSSPAGVGKGT